MSRSPGAKQPDQASGRPRRRFSALLAAIAATSIATMVSTAHAAVETYSVDPVHTRVMFAISHAGFSNALGTVSGSTGTISFDPDDLASAQLSVSVPMSCIDLGDDKWNAAALANNLLDSQAYPVATFVSTRVEPIDATHAIVHGTMTLHGVAQDAALQVTFNQLKRHPLPPFRRTAGFSASATIKRTAFGITAWQSVIGDSVELRIEAEATRSTAEVIAPPAAAPTGNASGKTDNVPDTAPVGRPTPHDAAAEPLQAVPEDNEGDPDTGGAP